tara:strand:+ start:85 stop:597 length:513 start_codon:yes stop_codon:yes gene_type:complete
MISDYLKKYSTYYLSRYNVTKRKFEDILKKKITKDYLEKKIPETDYYNLMQEISVALKYFEEIGFFNEERMLEISFENFVQKGYSKKKIKYKFLSAKFDTEKTHLFLEKKFNDQSLNQTLLKNYLNKSNIVEKQKKLNISEKQLFDKILSKLSQQGFEYEDSIKILNKII